MPDSDEIDTPSYWRILNMMQQPQALCASLESQKTGSYSGERFIYSNIAFNVLGDMIAKVSGISLKLICSSKS